MGTIREMEMQTTEQTEQCYCCKGRTVVDETNEIGWIEVPCPVCTKPRTAEEYEAKKQEMLDTLDSLKGYKPAWMNAS